MRKKFSDRIRAFLWEFKPRLYNLADVYMIRWLNYEWIIKK